MKWRAISGMSSRRSAQRGTRIRHHTQSTRTSPRGNRPALISPPRFAVSTRRRRGHRPRRGSIPLPSRKSAPATRARSYSGVSIGMSATSSRNKVPPCARSKVPTLRGPPSIRVSVPNSSISSRSRPIVAQLTGINGPFDAETAMRDATTTPLSRDPADPVIRNPAAESAPPAHFCCRALPAGGGCRRVEVSSARGLHSFVLCAPVLGRPRPAPLQTIS